MSPKSKEQFEQARQQTKSVIKETALDLFAHRGYASTSISQIAKAAKVSKGLMYNYFESKEALVKEIINDAMEASEVIFQDKVRPELPPEKQLEGLVHGVFDMVLQNTEYWKLLTAFALQDGALGEMELEMKQKSLQYLDLLVHLFDQIGATQPKNEAFLFSASLDGAMLAYMSMREEYPMKEMRQYIIQKFCTRRTESKAPSSD